MSTIRPIRFAPAACAVFLVFAAITPALAEKTVAPATVAVADLAWIAGDWRGAKDGTEVEEIWSPPAADAMMGMFRWHGGGEVRLYEFMVIEASDDGPILRLKHFSPGLRGWEEKDESLGFELVEAAPRRAVFLFEDENETAHLTYERKGDALTVTLHKVTAKGETTSVFSYRSR